MSVDQQRRQDAQDPSGPTQRPHSQDEAFEARSPLNEGGLAREEERCEFASAEPRKPARRGARRQEGKARPNRTASLISRGELERALDLARRSGVRHLHHSLHRGGGAACSSSLVWSLMVDEISPAGAEAALEHGRPFDWPACVAPVYQAGLGSAGFVEIAVAHDDLDGRGVLDIRQQA